uniref:UPAR/Ly6 domain-containing protein n=1 Tax=Cyprinus carpio carpio TaxID=630221 RepID=A0A9J7Y9D4_CYPCA
MHLRVSIVLLSILLTGGFSLDCYNCHDQQGGPCSKSTCYAEPAKCVSSKGVQYIAGTKVEFISKSCSETFQCKNWSISTGSWRKNYAVQCCNTDFCNEQDAPDLSSHNPNGKRCYTCDWEDCSKTLSCWGNEDYCFTSKGRQGVTKGCTSKFICDQDYGKFLLQNDGVSCCSGNLCNGAQSVTQSFLFLCCSLLSFILLH